MITAIHHYTPTTNYLHMLNLNTLRRLFFILLTIVPAWVMAQQKVITPDAFIALIKQNHPVAKQAAIQVDKAGAELQSARGGFDPVLDVDASKKTFDGKNYYTYTNPELKIPTPLPIDVKAGLEDNAGLFTEPELTKGKSSYLGVELALAKGFLIDKRRAALKQAKIFLSQSEQERRTIINNILFEAYADYFAWAGAYQQLRVYNQFLENSNKRLRLVRIGFNNGDRSEMDTIEAYTQWQNFQLQQAEANLKWINASLQLSNYLWQENGRPLQIPAQWMPDTVQFALESNVGNADNAVTQSNAQNPVLKSYQYKIESLQVEKRLKFQSLLPYFSVKANLLSKEYYQPKGFGINYLENNYKWGVDFKIPLLLREGRGDYRKAQLKIKEASLELSNKQWQVENKIRSYAAENAALGQQLSTIQGVYNNYKALLKNEELKFSQGESTLFLLNSRENKVLEAVQKQIELRVKYQKSRYAVDWAAGLLQ